jgi:diguanylate cyclase (GGDEF)-like protein
MKIRRSAPPPSITRKVILFLIGLLAVMGIGLLDIETSPELVLALFYLIPIVWESWYVSRGAGWVLSILSAVAASYATDVQMGYLTSQPGIALWAFVTRLVIYLLTATLASRLRETLDRSELLSRTDDLTQAINARAFFDLLAQELRRGRRYGRPLTVVYLDLDNFKAVNDTSGHHTGNAVLQTVTAAVYKSVREADSVARMGGDEFAILLPETDEEAARVIIPRLQNHLMQEMQRNAWPITFSIGVLTCQQTDSDTDAVFRKVDGLMYQVKHKGKNGISYEVLSGQA